MREFLGNLQHIDRRWVYLFVFVACTLPFIVTIRLPLYVSPETKGVYDMIEKCPPGKVVVVDSSWDAGSMGENQGQVEVVFDHLFRKNIPFIVTAQGFVLTAPQFSEKVIEKLVRTKYPHKKYGVDWVNLGVTMGLDWQIMQQMAKDITKQFPKDYKQTPVEKLPLMKRFLNKDKSSIEYIHMIHAVTYSPSENWLAFIHGQYGTPISFGCAGIQSTTYYRYISSKQLCGMLVGIRGSAEYDALLNPKPEKRWTLGTKLIVPLSFGYLIIIFAIIVGNIGFIASGRGKRR